MGTTLWERYRPCFETTQWSRVIKPGQEGARQALADLCQAYWQPLYCYIRARGFPPHEAEDLTQGLFTSLLAPGALARVDQERGRFRDWIRQVARNFLCNEIDRRKARRNGGGSTLIVIDVDVAEESLRLDADAALTPDRIFDRRWAVTVTARAMARVRQDFAKEGKAEAFGRLEGLLSGEEDHVSDAALSELLGRTPGDLRVERHRLRKRLEQRFRRYLHDEIDQTVASRHDVNEEIRLLLLSLP